MDFVFIGPPKSGSTWLHQILSAHPEIAVPAAKDIFYFDRHFERGEQWFRAQLPTGQSTSTLKGDVGHDYIFSQDALRRIASLPERVKIFAILREHGDWALSSYRFAARNGRFGGTFDDFLTVRPDVWKLNYSQLLAPLVSRESFRAFLFDHLQDDPLGFSEEIFGFLGVKTATQELTSLATRSVNKSKAARYAPINRVVKSSVPILRRAGLGAAVQTLKMNSQVRKLLFVDHKESSADSSNYGSAIERVRLHFEADRADLSGMIGEDLEQLWGP